MINALIPHRILGTVVCAGCCFGLLQDVGSPISVNADVKEVVV